MREGTKIVLAKALGISRSALYYVSRKEEKDWDLKAKIEAVLRQQPSYGSRRIAQELALNRKGVQRVMRQFGIRPYRRRGRKWRKKRVVSVIYANLLTTTIPSYPDHVWAADFTELWYPGRWVYVATVIDLFSREIVGAAVSLRKGTPLTLQALGNALMHRRPPSIFHSDNGREYEARAFIDLLQEFNILINTRIHSALKMPPAVFMEQQKKTVLAVSTYH